jgi:hypothetical protein
VGGFDLAVDVKLDGLSVHGNTGIATKVYFLSASTLPAE